MAYDQGLAERIHGVLEAKRGVTEKRMFGGLALMAQGHMFVGIVGDLLMARVGPAGYEEALQRAHVRVMDFTGKPMNGYVFVEPPGFEDDDELRAWVDRCFAFVHTLAPKHPR